MKIKGKEHSTQKERTGQEVSGICTFLITKLGVTQRVPRNEG